MRLTPQYMYDATDRAHSFAGTVEYMAPGMFSCVGAKLLAISTSIKNLIL